MKNNVKLIIIIFFSNRNTNFELIYYYSFVQIFLFKTLIDKCHIFIIKRQLTRPEQELMYAPFSSIVEISPCRTITNNLCDKTGLKSWLPLLLSFLVTYTTFDTSGNFQFYLSVKLDEPIIVSFLRASSSAFRISRRPNLAFASENTKAVRIRLKNIPTVSFPTISGARSHWKFNKALENFHSGRASS